MPLSAKERAKRRIEKLKANGQFQAYKIKRNAIAKKSRDKLKKDMERLPSRVYAQNIVDIRQKTRDRVRKCRKNRRNAEISTQKTKTNISRNISTDIQVNEASNDLVLETIPNDAQNDGSDSDSLHEDQDSMTITCNSERNKLTEISDTTPSPSEHSIHPQLIMPRNDVNGVERRSVRLRSARQKIPNQLSDPGTYLMQSSSEHYQRKRKRINGNDGEIRSVPLRGDHQEISNELSNSGTNSTQSLPEHSINPQRKRIRNIGNDGGRKCDRLCRVVKNKTVIPTTYQTTAAKRKAVSRACQALPKCANKRREVVISMYEKYVCLIKKKIIRPRSSRLNEETSQSVIQFYERDDISQQAPGLKDFIKVKDASGTIITHQIKYLMYPIRTVYQKYCAEMKSTPLKLSKFFALRPKHVISVTKIPHTVCLCPYHENFACAWNAIRKIALELPEYGDKEDSFYKTFFCETMSKNCWHNECDECKDMFRDVLLGIAINASLTDPMVKWLVWKEFDWTKDGKVKGKRWQRVTETGTVNDLVEYILRIAPHFILHVLIKRKQSERYQEDIKSMDPTVATLQMDFAENPVCVYQKQIQRAHFNQNQLSLLTAASWICRKVQSHAIVSDNLDHTKAAIVPYVDRILEGLPDIIKTVKIWSDGPSKQFKNKFIAASLDPLEKKFNIKIEWNFFATSHGKGPVDGIGGALKRQVRQKVMGSNGIEVRNAEEFVAAVDKESKVNVILMSENDAVARAESLNLSKIWDKAPDVKGIFNFHHLSVTAGKVIGKATSQTF